MATKTIKLLLISLLILITTSCTEQMCTDYYIETTRDEYGVVHKTEIWYEYECGY